MENKMILLDTSVLIDYFRKTEKSNSYFSKLAGNQNASFAVSVITEFEIFFGSTDQQLVFWRDIFGDLVILDLDSKCISAAIEIQKDLKRMNRMLDVPDLLIAATAVKNGLEIATLNKKHFGRIGKLKILE